MHTNKQNAWEQQRRLVATYDIKLRDRRTEPAPSLDSSAESDHDHRVVQGAQLLGGE